MFSEVNEEDGRELTGMDRMHMIKEKRLLLLYPAYPVHPCSNFT
jgi:hypothetical protein